MGAGVVEPMDLLERRRTRAAVYVMRHVVEYVHHAREVPRLRSPVEVDIMLAVPRVVAARRLV